jgi:hypothetical protein
MSQPLSAESCLWWAPSTLSNVRASWQGWSGLCAVCCDHRACRMPAQPDLARRLCSRTGARHSGRSGSAGVFCLVRGGEATEASTALVVSSYRPRNVHSLHMLPLSVIPSGHTTRATSKLVEPMTTQGSPHSFSTIALCTAQPQPKQKSATASCSHGHDVQSRGPGAYNATET